MLEKFFSIIGGSIGPKKGSKDWFRALPDDEFYRIYENVRQAYCNGDEDAVDVMEMLKDLDFERENEKFKREHPDWDKKPHTRWTDANRWEKD